MTDHTKSNSLRRKIHDIIFEADTKLGKIFDEVLMGFILLSVIVVMLDSVPDINNKYEKLLKCAEWFFTIIFSIEYILRVWTTKKASSYIFSFYGIIDLMSIVPTFLGLFLVGTHFLVVIRILRLLRIFRVFKLVQFMGASHLLIRSMQNSKHKIAIFFLIVLFTVTIMGSFMYIIESPEAGFTSIPKSIYWAIVTLTTVGYGDIAPQTVMGQTLASLVMLLGYAIIAVPTGILTSEIVSESKRRCTNTHVCNNCNADYHDDGANFCKDCGTEL